MIYLIRLYLCVYHRLLLRHLSSCQQQEVEEQVAVLEQEMVPQISSTHSLA